MQIEKAHIEFSTEALIHSPFATCHSPLAIRPSRPLNPSILGCFSRRNGGFINRSHVFSTIVHDFPHSCLLSEDSFLYI